MEHIVAELGLPTSSVAFTTAPGTFSAIVHCSWLQQLMKDKRADACINIPEQPFVSSEPVGYPWKKIFITVLQKKIGKVLPLPSCKSNNSEIEAPLTYSQILQYISQANQRNLWKEAYKKYCHNTEANRENVIVSLVEHDQLLSEVILRLYGCNIIRVKTDTLAIPKEYTEVIPNKYVSKSYEPHANILPALFVLETEKNFFIVHNTHMEHNLIDCLTFSPALLEGNYCRGMFVIYQLLQMAKATSDRGLSIGNLMLDSIYLTENLWLQIIPQISVNIHMLDASLIYEQVQNKASTYSLQQKRSSSASKDGALRNSLVSLEKMLHLWLTGQVSNLTYLLYLNELAGRRSGDPHAHFVVPWVTDFSSRCGRNWRDLTKSKYRLTKGDRQLDMTYDVLVRENNSAPPAPGQTPHHVSDVLSDITYYVYTARRTPKEILCKHVRNKWVPAEYPASIQRMQEWSPDECIPEFFTDPTVFKSLHEDLPELEVPSWATCVEDFVVKHREALESSYVSEHLHHWIDLTFGYKLSGAASVKAKNVCLSLVDGHTRVRRGGAVQLFPVAHPARAVRPHPAAPPRIHWLCDKKKATSNDSSEEVSDEDESSGLPQHVSRLSVPAHRPRARRPSPRTRSVSLAPRDTPASSTTRHYKVQRSEMGKGLIYLPKEYNPVRALIALEALNNFKTKCLCDNDEDKDNKSLVDDTMNDYKVNMISDENSFTNYMFDQNYSRKMNQDAQLESVLKERKNRSFNNRYTTDGQVYKQFVTEGRRQNMLVIGCIIVEIFLHNEIQSLRTNFENFTERYNTCRKVLKYNYLSMPRCVSYVVGLLLNVQPPRLSLNTILGKHIDNDKAAKDKDVFIKITVTEKGLPPPTPTQLLQPLLFNHLIPFPDSIVVIYNLIVTLHEYEIASRELNILYTYQCDGVECETYRHIDKTKLHFTQKIAEGKVQACAAHIESFINKLPCYNQFDLMDIFLPHYVELLENRDTSILAAWYLFDTVSKALGPVESRKKLLKHIIDLYEDDDMATERPDKLEPDVVNNSEVNFSNKKKSVKLYHNIFLLQLIVRFGLRCFLEHFTQHLVEAVGGYKDMTGDSVSPGHICRSKSINVNKKPRYSDDTVKSALFATGEILSPDTSFGSENVITPVEKFVPNDRVRSAPVCKGDPEVFHFERDKFDCKDFRHSRSKSPAESIDSFSSSNAGNQDANMDILSPIADTGLNTSPTKITFAPNVELNVASAYEVEGFPGSSSEKVTSPTIPIPSSLKTSHDHFGDNEDNSSSDEVEFRTKHIRSLDFLKYSNKQIETLKTPRSNEEDINKQQGSKDIESAKLLKISDMSVESLIWLAYRLGPVLTCRYITKNLLKMLTLCYIGKENLSSSTNTTDLDDIESTSIANGNIVGDKNAKKVIKCLTSIVALYGEQLILFQYLPHMGELIASCRRRLSVPLEGGVIACLQLLKYLVPFITDVKLMEQLQDVILKTILHPIVRLMSTTRRAFPSGRPARAALATKFLDTLYVVAVRIGPEMTRKHLCVPALQRQSMVLYNRMPGVVKSYREGVYPAVDSKFINIKKKIVFFLAFDKAIGKSENWTNEAESEVPKSAEKDRESDEGCGEGSSFVEICRDGTTAEWCVRGGSVVRGGGDELACSPSEGEETLANVAREELLAVFSCELAHKALVPFYKLVGGEAMERSLKNSQTIHSLCHSYDLAHKESSSCNIRHSCETKFQTSLSDDTLNKRPPECRTEPVQIGTDRRSGRGDAVNDHISSSNSFGSKVALVGNRIDVEADCVEYGSMAAHNYVLDVVSYKMDNGVKNNRHLRGDWLIYWEHEIGRPDKESRFNLKQIKLQSFSGHSHSVKCLHGLDNENSFMSGSKDKTVKLWSLRNQGDGSAVSQCQWTYTGHKKGVLSLSFLESQRMAVSTDSVVHIWDPFMESVVSQLDSIKVPVSIVRTMPAPSPVVIAATTDNALKMIDARTCTFTHDLKITPGGSTFIRCVCVSPSGRWVCVGLASGHLALLDPRTGLLIAHWKAHDGEILQLVTFNEENVVSSSLDQTVMVWSTVDGKIKFHLKGSTEPVHCLSAYYGELISGTTNNRIGVHTAVDRDASFSSTKLRADTFRGVLTCLAVLPLNRLLLLGNDGGNITLLC